MAQTDLLKRYLDAGVAFTQLTQQRAEEIVRDLVKSGEVQTDDARRRVEELVDRSRQNTEGLVAMVRSEVQTQITRLGLVPKKELDALKKELADLRGAGATAKTPPAKKAAKKAAAAPAKAAAKKAPAKKVAGASKKATKAASKRA